MIRLHGPSHVKTHPRNARNSRGNSGQKGQGKMRQGWVADGTGLDYTDRQVMQVEAAMRHFVDARVAEGLFSINGRYDLNRGSIGARLDPWSEREISQGEIENEIRKSLADLPGARPRIRSGNSLGLRGGAGGGLSIALTGPAYPDIAADAFAEAFSSVRGLAQSSLPEGIGLIFLGEARITRRDLLSSRRNLYNCALRRVSRSARTVREPDQRCRGDDHRAFWRLRGNLRAFCSRHDHQHLQPDRGADVARNYGQKRYSSR